MRLKKLLMAFAISVIAVFSLCCSNEIENKTLVNEDSSANLQTKPGKQVTQKAENTDDDDWSDGWDDDDDYDPNWREKIKQIDLSKSEQPFHDASRKWRIVRTDFENAYYKELQSMLKSGNSVVIEKALIYFY